MTRARASSRTRRIRTDTGGDGLGILLGSGVGSEVSDSKDIIDRAIENWQPRTERRLTREDGREIIENMTGFFKVLLEWDERERRAARAPKPRSKMPHDAEFDCAPNPVPAE